VSNQRKDVYISILTAASVVVILIQYIYPLNMIQMQFVYTFDFIVAVILAIDFYYRMKSSKDKHLKFLLKHCYEIPAMIPLFTFAILENQDIAGAGARALRLIRLFRLLQLFFRTLRIFEGYNHLYFVAFSAMAVILASFAVYNVETSAEGSTIRNIGDAFWWAFSTVTTASYGDVYPVTIEGKVISVVLMFVGLAILGVFISTLGASIIESRIRKPRPALVTDEIKALIMKKIEGIESLSENDFDDLMLNIRSLRDMKARK
jgi:voltage-gated potassium channel